LDLAPTFCSVAGIAPAEWMQGAPLPTRDGSGRERALCEWDSQFPGYGMHMRTIYRDGWLCTVYEPSTAGQPNGMEQVWGEACLTPTSIVYDGSEGELYNVRDDPHQWHNRWADTSLGALRSDLVADLRDSLPGEVRKLAVEAPA
jgi:arylsulfatase A-like enzyme